MTPNPTQAQRGKAEAIAKPMAGDRWSKQRKLFTDRVRAVQIVTEDSAFWVEGGGSKIYGSTLPAFRRWASTAEYLGNATLPEVLT